MNSLFEDTFDGMIIFVKNKIFIAIEEGSVIGFIQYGIPTFHFTKMGKITIKLRLFFMFKNRKERIGNNVILFMYGTFLEGTEQLMVMVPNFQPRGSGIVINNYFNCQGGVKDCNCNNMNVNKNWNKCGYIGSHLKTKMDRYKDLVRECFGKINNYLLKGRLKNLTNKSAK